MRRLKWLFLLLGLAFFLPRRESLPRDMTPLALHLGERFGRTNLDYSTQRDHKRLELLLTDRRWNGLNDVVVDSARVVAQYALADLKGFPRPDTIVVTIRTVHRWGGMVQGTTGIHLAAAEL